VGNFALGKVERWCLSLPGKKDEIKPVASAERELQVKKANLRAWNYWGRIWRLDRRRSSPSSYALHLMRTRQMTYRNVYLKMVETLGGLSGKSVLDVGCGTSEYHVWLANDCDRLIGVDISLEMLKLCREDTGKSIELVAADASHLPFRKEAVDTSMTFQALHHFPDWQSALAEMVRIGEGVVLYEPNAESILHKFMHKIRQTFRVEQRFKQIDEDYELVEFKAGGFSSAHIVHFLNRNDMNTRLFMFGFMPVSLLDKASRLSRRLLVSLFAFEDLLRKIPIVRSQLGGMLVIAWKSKQKWE